jgi:uncharacterized protein YecT (DUF1311 family)
VSVLHSFRLPIPFLLLALLHPLAAAAADEATACKDAATTAAMRACENKRYQDADRQLNMVYTRLMATLDNNQKEKLRLAQRAWLQFRDANSDFQAAAAGGGTLSPLLKIAAMADMTEARLKELTNYHQP